VRILLTGSTGFFGTWFKQSVNCTLSTRENYQQVLKGEYDYIIHLAPTPIEPIIECAKKNNASVLYASSGAVYGGAKQRCKETDYPNPKTSYAVEKLRSENLLIHSGLDYKICRLFTFCGEHMRDYFAITAFVNAVKNNKPLKLYGGGLSIRTYLYAKDAVDWMLKILHEGYGVYNIGSERQISIRELANEVSGMVIPRADIISDKREFHDPAPYYVPNCDKAHRLGLFQTYDLDYGIRRMLDA